MRREPAASDGTVPSLARRSPARRANATDSRDVRPSPPREDHERRRRPPQNTRRRGGGQERGEARGDGRRRRRPFLPTVSPIELFADRRGSAAGRSRTPRDDTQDPHEARVPRHGADRSHRSSSRGRRNDPSPRLSFFRTFRDSEASAGADGVARKNKNNFAPQRAKRRASETRSSHISEYERISPFVDI